MNSLPVGKLELEYLAQLLAKYARLDDRVLAGAGIGEDATVIDFGDRYLVAKTDPITLLVTRSAGTPSTSTPTT